VDGGNVRIDAETLAASGENYTNRPKVPITQMNHPTAIGIELLYSLGYNGRFLRYQFTYKRKWRKDGGSHFQRFPSGIKPKSDIFISEEFVFQSITWVVYFKIMTDRGMF
jgi:hypothetical protein